jgi:hypothetical protein
MTDGETLYMNRGSTETVLMKDSLTEQKLICTVAEEWEKLNHHPRGLILVCWNMQK